MVGLEKKIHIGECFGEVNLFEVSPLSTCIQKKDMVGKSFLFDTVYDISEILYDHVAK